MSEEQVITVRLSEDLHQRFKKLAYRRETSMNKLAIRVIEDVVIQSESQQEEELVASKPR